jgi:PilZ domain
MCADRIPNPRRSRRFPAQLPVKLVLGSLQTRSACDALTLDISQAGARVRASVPLSPGQSVQVVPNEGIKRAIPGRIVWVSRLLAGPQGEAGIEFVQP